MHPSNEMQRICNGKRYNVATATLLASDEYWDGSNFERHGRNTFLFKTRGGAFFEVNLTQWEGERDTLLPLTEDEAREKYENLPEHHVDYETAFNTVVEEATAGRDPIYDKTMHRTGITLPEEMIAWLKNHGNMSDIIRELVQAEMDKPK